MKCVSFKALERGSLLGFADLQMDSGLVVLGCTFHTSNGKKWVNPPGRPQLDTERKPMLENGKIVYAPVLAFATDKLRFRWSGEAAKAIDEFIAQSKEPAAAGSMSGEATQAAGQRVRG